MPYKTSRHKQVVPSIRTWNGCIHFTKRILLAAECPRTSVTAPALLSSSSMVSLKSARVLPFGIAAERLSRCHQLYATVLLGFPFPLLLLTLAPLGSRWLDLYNTVQGKYLLKSRWLSKPCLSSMEVVIDDFCLLHLKCCIYTGLHSFLLDYFFQDLSPGFSSITPCSFLLGNNTCLHVRAIGWILQNLYWQAPFCIWICHVFERKSSWLSGLCKLLVLTLPLCLCVLWFSTLCKLLHKLLVFYLENTES